MLEELIATLERNNIKFFIPEKDGEFDIVALGNTEVNREFIGNQLGNFTVGYSAEYDNFYYGYIFKNRSYHVLFLDELGFAVAYSWRNCKNIAPKIVEVYRFITKSKTPEKYEIVLSKEITYGNILSKEEFINDVNSGALIDYDGFGEAVIGKYVVKYLYIWPSKAQEFFTRHPSVKYIVWYNR